ncbi:MAG: hypothetical protein LBR36_06610 [Bacteroidales bacterium]|jgi:hypothetical protein|nr:hypothetical protein [Bacteroidales bacterium]
MPADEIHYKYYPTVPDSVFWQIMETDSISSNIATKKMGKYAKWLLNLYKTDNLKTEDLYKAEEYLPVFDKAVKHNQLKINDLNKYKSLSEMYVVIQDFIETPIESKTEIIKEIKHEEAEKLYEDEDYLLVHTKTYAANCLYGKGTQWCTTSNIDTFESYNKKGKLYILILKKSEKKFQLHYEEENPKLYMSDYQTCQQGERISYITKGYSSRYYNLYAAYNPSKYEPYITDEMDRCMHIGRILDSIKNPQSRAAIETIHKELSAQCLQLVNNQYNNLKSIVDVRNKNMAEVMSERTELVAIINEIIDNEYGVIFEDETFKIVDIRNPCICYAHFGKTEVCHGKGSLHCSYTMPLKDRLKKRFVVIVEKKRNEHCFLEYLFPTIEKKEYKRECGEESFYITHDYQDIINYKPSRVIYGNGRRDKYEYLLKNLEDFKNVRSCVESFTESMASLALTKFLQLEKEVENKNIQIQQKEDKPTEIVFENDTYQLAYLHSRPTCYTYFGDSKFCTEKCYYHPNHRDFYALVNKITTEKYMISVDKEWTQWGEKWETMGHKHFNTKTLTCKNMGYIIKIENSKYHPFMYLGIALNSLNDNKLAKCIKNLPARHWLKENPQECIDKIDKKNKEIFDKNTARTESYINGCDIRFAYEKLLPNNNCTIIIPNNHVACCHFGIKAQWMHENKKGLRIHRFFKAENFDWRNKRKYMEFNELLYTKNLFIIIIFDKIGNHKYQLCNFYIRNMEIRFFDHFILIDEANNVIPIPNIPLFYSLLTKFAKQGRSMKYYYKILFKYVYFLLDFVREKEKQAPSAVIN